VPRDSGGCRLRAWCAAIVILATSCGRASDRAAAGAADTGRAAPELSLPAAATMDSIPSVVAAPLNAEQRRGQALYASFCWTCHGLYGHGDGPGARGFREPLPDLERVAAARTVDGIVARLLAQQPTSGAPPAQAARHTLDSAQLHAAAAFIKSFAPPGARGNAAAGRLLFASYCVHCHGTRGAGDGRLAGTLARRPADLRLADVAEHPDRVIATIRSGDSTRHGRYMPNWSQAFSDQELWDLVAYLQVLQAAR